MKFASIQAKWDAKRDSGSDSGHVTDDRPSSVGGGRRLGPDSVERPGTSETEEVLRPVLPCKCNVDDEWVGVDGRYRLMDSV